MKEENVIKFSGILEMGRRGKAKNRGEG